MKTEGLLAALAADAPRGPALGRRVAGLLLSTLPLAGAGMLALLMLTLGLRDGLATTLASPVLFKTLLPLALAALAGAAAFQLARPSAFVRPLLRRLSWLLAAGAVAVLIVTLAMTAPGTWAVAAFGLSIPVCLVMIPALSLLPLTALLAALRQGASTDLARSGLMAGLAAGGMAAAIYSLHCPEDSPLFFLLWYGLGVVFAGGVGRWLGPHALKW